MELTQEIVDAWELGQYIGFKGDTNRFLVGKGWDGVQLANITWNDQNFVEVSFYKLSNIELDYLEFVTNHVPEEKNSQFPPITISGREYFSHEVDYSKGDSDLKSRYLHILTGGCIK